jgi:hypothetical protein
MAAPILQYGLGNSASTTNSSSVSNADTSIPLTSSTNFQAAPTPGEGMALLDEGNATEELAYSTGLSGSSLTTPLANRGLEGGSAQSHTQGSSVKGILTVGMWNNMITALLNAFVQSTGAVDTTKVVTPTGTQTLTNKTLTSPTINSGVLATPEITGDMDLETATANITVNDLDPKRAIYVPAVGMYPSTTAPCASISQVESSTNDVNIKVLAFDGAGTSKEYAEFGIQSPSYWDASTVTVQFIWYAAAGSGTVNWEAQGLALSDDDALDTAYGTLQEVTDTLTAIGDVHITAETAAITIAGSPVAGDWLQFKIARDPANDTNTSDALLMGVRVRFGIAQYNDA